MEPKPIRFGCTGCGQCCKGRGEVFFSPQEFDNIVELLELSKSGKRDLRKKLIQKKENGMLVHSTGGRCALLSDDDRCTVYEARPIQCRSYPFWPSFFQGKSDFRRLNEECEGIGHESGHDYSALSVKRRLNKTRRAFDGIQTLPGELTL